MTKNEVFNMGRLEGMVLLSQTGEQLVPYGPKDSETLCAGCHDPDTGVSPCHVIPSFIAADPELHNTFCAGVISVVNQQMWDDHDAMIEGESAAV
jgi:hypothetical protein